MSTLKICVSVNLFGKHWTTAANICSAFFSDDLSSRRLMAKILLQVKYIVKIDQF